MTTPALEQLVDGGIVIDDTFPSKLRFAASVLREANTRTGSGTQWSVAGLEAFATEVEIAEQDDHLRAELVQFVVDYTGSAVDEFTARSLVSHILTEVGRS
ncbi:hypothetical protein JVX90_13875 [Gordonia sp. PDNC005]|uniref:hypothetical protein n=1 Tax=Gordonia sp. PDNC005 TaxID=2811424 RepID=UPI0019625443|nr:hypothetical protein [Gordonia sp. PDNC005]QRY61501.1 hypothetical protein JVX90_13875 [Gordonia sp. PDNC005]